MRSRAGLLSVALFAVAFPSLAYRTSAWVPAWDPNALTSMQLNAGRLDEANPGWYTLSPDGGFTANWNAEDPSLRAALAGVDLIPTIKNYVGGTFDGGVVAAVVGSATLRAKHADALTQLVVQNAFDGIDVDYEAMPASSRADFSLFVELLAQKLHAAGKRLSVSVHAKTSDAGDWDGPASEDWAVIGAAADTVKIMAYDEHYDGSAAGAITPLDWLDAVATYAESILPAGKIIMGLPWYGYDWVGTSAASLTYDEAIATARAQGVPVSHDANGEATFRYGAHTVYFQDASAYARKVQLLTSRHPGIGGFAHWRVGSEDPAMWQTVESVHGGSGPTIPVTPAAESFTVAGPQSVAVRAGQVSRTAYQLVAINGFNATASVSIAGAGSFPGRLSVTGSASPSSPAVLTVAPSATALAGTYAVRVRMTSGSLVDEVAVTLSVEPSNAKHRVVRR